MQAVRGFSQIAAQKQQLKFPQKQQLSTQQQAAHDAHGRQESPRKDPAVSQNIAYGNTHAGLSSSTLSVQLQQSQTITQDSRAGLPPLPQTLSDTHIDALSGSGTAGPVSHPHLSWPEGKQINIAITQSIPAQPRLAICTLASKEAGPAETTDRSTTLARPSKKRSMPEPDILPTNCKAAQHPHASTRAHAQKLPTSLPTSAQAIGSRSAKCAKPAAERQAAHHSALNSKASKVLTTAHSKAITAGKACRIHAVDGAGQRADEAQVSNTQLQQERHEPVRRQSQRTHQAKTAAVVDTSSEHGSDNSNYADDMSAASSDPEQEAHVGKASTRKPASQNRLHGRTQTGPVHVHTQANPRPKRSQQVVSSSEFDGEEDVSESVVCNSDDDDADSGGDILGKGPKECIARKTRVNRLPIKAGLQQQVGAQQAKHAAAFTGRGASSKAGRGGHKRAATRQNFVRCNLKASCAFIHVKGL